MGEVILDALIDTLKVLPFLLVMNFVIELVEYKTNGIKANKALKGGLAPLIGTAVGIVPQCGFSVIATELYSKRKITMGTLLAVYIATSDEALPIMLSSYAGVTKILPIIIIKVVFALVVGYAAFAVQKIVEAKHKPAPTVDAESGCAEDGANGCDHEHEHEHEHDESVEDDEAVHVHGCHHHALGEEHAAAPENATKAQRAARIFDLYFKHPLIHTATVVLFIFIVNIAFGIAVYYVGSDAIADFIGKTGYFQPLLAALVGLIPNCAASVVITELYVVGGLSLGGAVAGLSVGAGIGYAVLVRDNRPPSNTALIIVVMFVSSVALGMAVNAIV